MTEAPQSGPVRRRRKVLAIACGAAGAALLLTLAISSFLAIPQPDVESPAEQPVSMDSARQPGGTLPGQQPIAVPDHSDPGGEVDRADARRPLECTSGAPKPPSDTTSIDAWNQFQQQVADYHDRISRPLRASDDAEHLLTAGLLASDIDESLALLQAAASREPRNSVITRLQLSVCRDDRAKGQCNVSERVRKLIELEPNNSESWIELMKHSYEAGDSDAALDALRRAGAAGESSIGYIQIVETLERALAAGGLSFGERLTLAFNVAAGSALPSYSTVMRACRDNAPQNLVWRESCLAYGARLEVQAQAILPAAIGLALQIAMLEIAGDPAEIAAARERRRRDKARTQSQLSDMDRTSEATVYMQQNPALYAKYVGEIHARGEWAAYQLLLDEVQRLKTLGWEPPCGFESPEQAP